MDESSNAENGSNNNSVAQLLAMAEDDDDTHPRYHDDDESNEDDDEGSTTTETVGENDDLSPPLMQFELPSYSEHEVALNGTEPHQQSRIPLAEDVLLAAAESGSESSVAGVVEHTNPTPTTTTTTTTTIVVPYGDEDEDRLLEEGDDEGQLEANIMAVPAVHRPSEMTNDQRYPQDKSDDDDDDDEILIADDEGSSSSVAIDTTTSFLQFEIPAINGNQQDEEQSAKNLVLERDISIGDIVAAGSSSQATENHPSSVTTSTDTTTTDLSTKQKHTDDDGDDDECSSKDEIEKDDDSQPPQEADHADQERASSSPRKGDIPRSPLSSSPTNTPGAPTQEVQDWKENEQAVDDDDDDDDDSLVLSVESAVLETEEGNSAHGADLELAFKGDIPLRPPSVTDDFCNDSDFEQAFPDLENPASDTDSVSLNDDDNDEQQPDPFTADPLAIFDDSYYEPCKKAEQVDDTEAMDFPLLLTQAIKGKFFKTRGGGDEEAPSLVDETSSTVLMSDDSGRALHDFDDSEYYEDNNDDDDVGWLRGRLPSFCVSYCCNTNKNIKYMDLRSQRRRRICLVLLLLLVAVGLILLVTLPVVLTRGGRRTHGNNVIPTTSSNATDSNSQPTDVTTDSTTDTTTDSNTTTTSPPTAQPTNTVPTGATCGCSSCVESVWNTDASGFSCGERIGYLIKSQDMSERDACARVAGVEFFDVCGACDPLRCGIRSLLWSEEFNGDDGNSDGTGRSSVNESVWTHDLGDWGWGNQEFQEYTRDNGYVENGDLVIRTERNGNKFTSARLNTLNKFSFVYGDVEAMVKFPDLRGGLWPALWLLGATFPDEENWPRCGEIDIFEMGSGSAKRDGVVNRRVGSHAHWQGKNSKADWGDSLDMSKSLNDGEYHKFTMSWTPTEISTTIDDQLIMVFDISKIKQLAIEEFHKPFSLIVNMAVGGTYTGIMQRNDITATFPAELRVDYIRVYGNDYTVIHHEGDNNE